MRIQKFRSGDQGLLSNVILSLQFQVSTCLCWQVDTDINIVNSLQYGIKRVFPVWGNRKQNRRRKNLFLLSPFPSFFGILRSTVPWKITREVLIWDFHSQERTFFLTFKFPSFTVKKVKRFFSPWNLIVKDLFLLSFQDFLWNLCKTLYFIIFVCIIKILSI